MKHYKLYSDHTGSGVDSKPLFYTIGGVAPISDIRDAVVDEKMAIILKIKYPHLKLWETEEPVNYGISGDE